MATYTEFINLRNWGSFFEIECFTVNDIWLKFEEEFFVLFIIFSLFEIISRKCLNAFIIIPPRNRPDMCDFSFLSLPNLGSQVSGDGNIIPDTTFNHILSINFGIYSFGFAMPDPAYHNYND